MMMIDVDEYLECDVTRECHEEVSDDALPLNIGVVWHRVEKLSDGGGCCSSSWSLFNH